MTRVTFFRRGGVIVGFESKGHAGYDESGFDIVCAGVSALTTSCVNALEAVAHQTPSVRLDEEAGFLSVDLTDASDHDAQVILRTTELGIRSIANQYPGYVRVSSRNRR